MDLSLGSSTGVSGFLQWRTVYLRGVGGLAEAACLFVLLYFLCFGQCWRCKGVGVCGGGDNELNFLRRLRGVVTKCHLSNRNCASRRVEILGHVYGDVLTSVSRFLQGGRRGGGGRQGRGGGEGREGWKTGYRGALGKDLPIVYALMSWVNIMGRYFALNGYAVLAFSYVNLRCAFTFVIRKGTLLLVVWVRA